MVLIVVDGESVGLILSDRVDKSSSIFIKTKLSFTIIFNVLKFF